MLQRRSLLAALPLLPGGAPELELQVTRVEERPAPLLATSDLWLILDRSSRTAFGAWTRRRVGQGVQLRVDGELLVEARLSAPIVDGVVIVHDLRARRGAIQTVLSHAKGKVTAIAVP